MAWFGSYETVKYVSIKDARLGMMRLILVLAIAGYVIIVEMFQMGGYLASNPVVGVVRFSLQQPTVNECDPSVEGCTNAFLPLNNLKYCQQAAVNHTGYVGSVYPCEIYEAVNAANVRETSLVIWTKASIYNQSLICDGSIGSGSMTCPNTYKNQKPSPQPFYIAQSETFTVLLEHAVTASRICEHHGRRDSNKMQHYACSAEASRYQGRLYSTNEGLCRKEFAKKNSFDQPRGSTLQSNAPCFIGANQTASDEDFFSLDVLLQAAEVSLDDCMDVNSNGCTTYRESGATLLLNVVWNDFRPYRGLVEPFYYYSPQLIGTSYKESLPFYDSYRTSRTLMRAHGVKIAVLLAGSFHQFQMLPFLITLTTALGLLTLATKVVDSLMLSDRYLQIKYETMQEEAVESSRSSTVMGNEDNHNRANTANILELLPVSELSNKDNQDEGQADIFSDDNSTLCFDMNKPLLAQESDSSGIS